MKSQMTRKQLESFAEAMGYPIYVTSYCYVSNNAKKAPAFYNKGVYGWNWDAYIIGDAVFIDGYRSFPKGKKLSEVEVKALLEKAGALK